MEIYGRTRPEFGGGLLPRFLETRCLLTALPMIDDVRIDRFDPIDPSVSSNSPSALVSGPISTIDGTFSEPMDAAAPGANDISVRDPNGTVQTLIRDPVKCGDQRTFSLNRATATAVQGTRGVLVLAGINNATGNSLNQESGASKCESQDEVFYGLFDGGY